MEKIILKKRGTTFKQESKPEKQEKGDNTFSYIYNPHPDNFLPFGYPNPWMILKIVSLHNCQHGCSCKTHKVCSLFMWPCQTLQFQSMEVLIIGKHKYAIGAFKVESSKDTNLA